MVEKLLGFKLFFELQKEVLKAREDAHNTLAHTDPFKNPSDIARAQGILEICEKFTTENLRHFAKTFTKDLRDNQEETNPDEN